MKKIYVICSLVFSLSILSLLAFWESNKTETTGPIVELSKAPQSNEEAFPHLVLPNESFYQSLSKFQIDSKTILDVVKAAKPIFNFSRLAPHTRFSLEKDTDGNLLATRFKISPTEVLKVEKTGETWQASTEEEDVKTQIFTFSNMVISTLWESAANSGMDPDLIIDLAEIFAWQVDFAREVRPNDRWRLSVEKKFVRGEAIGWGKILSAEYENRGELHTAILFTKNGENLGYFTPEGESLRKMFLKSPLKFGRITSTFQTKRFHPILKIRRPHLGVDYSAVKGTPVRAVGDGTIERAKWSGGGGNVVSIRHNSSYKTNYKHLNGYAKGIRPGAKVKQGQIIGYVGSTGLSTAPHLHFELFHNNRYVNPLGQKFPSASPVAEELKEEFFDQSREALALLPSWSEMEVSKR